MALAIRIVSGPWPGKRSGYRTSLYRQQIANPKSTIVL